MTERAFRFRFYPTPDQENLLRRTLDCVRLIYNKALTQRSQAWTQRREKISYNQTSSLLRAWKQLEELKFLAEVSAVPLQQSLRHLQKAFNKFWNKTAKHPRFKKKRNGGSAEFTKAAFRWKDSQVWLAKCSEPLAIRWSRPLPVNRLQKKLRRVQKALSRTQKGSKNREKARFKVARIHAKISDYRPLFSLQ